MTRTRNFWERLGFEEKSEKCCLIILNAGQLLLDYWFRVATHQHSLTTFTFIESRVSLKLRKHQLCVGTLLEPRYA